MISLYEYLIGPNASKDNQPSQDSCTIKDMINKIESKIKDGHLKENDKSRIHDKDKKEMTVGKLLSDLSLVADYIGEDSPLSDLSLDIDELEKFMNEH